MKEQHPNQTGGDSNRARDAGSAPSQDHVQLRAEIAGLPYQQQLERIAPARPLQFNISSTVPVGMVSPEGEETTSGVSTVQMTEGETATSTSAADSGPPREELERLIGDMEASSDEIREIWYELHHLIRAANRDAPRNAHNRILAIVQDIDERYSALEEQVEDTSLAPELSLHRADFERCFAAFINLQTFAGEVLSGAVRLPRLMDGTLTGHLMEMYSQARDASDAYVRVRTRTRSSSQREAVRSVDGNRFIFLRHLLEDTPVGELDITPFWAQHLDLTAWETILEYSERTNLTRAARAMAEAEDNGVPPERLEVLDQLVALAHALLEPITAPEPERYGLFRALLRSQDERVGLIRLLDSEGIYDRFMTRAPDELSEWLREGTGFAEPVRVEVGLAAIGQAASMYGEEFVLQALIVVLDQLGLSEEDFYSFVGNARETLTIIMDDPGGFIGNLFGALGAGFGQFSENFLEHLQASFLDWLTGQVGDTGITMPDELNLAGVFDLAMQVLGLTPEYLEQKATDILGEDTVELIREVWGFVEAAIEGGWAGLWDYIGEYLSSLWDDVVGQLQSWLLEQVVQGAIEWVIQSFGGPIGGLLSAVEMAWDIYTFVRDRGRELAELVMSLVNAMGEIARGNIQDAADAVEGVFANALTLAIDFLARLANIDGIGERVREIIEAIQARVDAAIDQMIEAVADLFRGGGSPETEQESDGDANDNRLPEMRFNDQSGESHRLWFRDTTLWVACDEEDPVTNAVSNRDGEFTNIESGAERDVLTLAGQAEGAARNVLAGRTADVQTPMAGISARLSGVEPLDFEALADAELEELLGDYYLGYSVSLGERVSGAEGDSTFYLGNIEGIRSEVGLKVYRPPTHRVGDGQLSPSWRDCRMELLQLARLGSIVPAPHVYGMVMVPELGHRAALAMDYVQGTPIPPHRGDNYTLSLDDLEEIQTIFEAIKGAGYDFAGDAQMLKEPDGIITVIDAASGLVTRGRSFATFLTFVLSLRTDGCVRDEDGAVLFGEEVWAETIRYADGTPEPTT